MKCKPMICVFTSVLILSLTCRSNIGAEPSKNMRYILNECVSIMDSLCYQLDKELHDRYEFKHHALLNLLYETVKKIGDKELITRYERIMENNKRYHPSVHFKVYFDFSSNRLNVDCSSHYYLKKHLEFKLYWEEPMPFGSIAGMIDLFRQKNYNVGKVNEIMTKPKPLKLPNGSVFEAPPITKYPRYEDLREQIYGEIDSFEFHYGYSMTSYDEDTIKKELIERLRIRIFQGSPIPRCLYREFYDGNWKKISLSPNVYEQK